MTPEGPPASPPLLGATLSGPMVYRTPQCRCLRSYAAPGLRTSLDFSRESHRDRFHRRPQWSRAVAAPVAAAARSDIRRGDGLSRAPMSLQGAEFYLPGRDSEVTAWSCASPPRLVR